MLVSIGYAACHWCHVMEKESFEDEETAALMNRHFVNIKIDREERPDIDHIYMDAVQAMTGHGGWPLNVFLTPDGRPFYGGTYFPPVRAFNRLSWKELLTAIHQSYSQKKHEIESQADNLVEYLKNTNAFGKGKAEEKSLFTEAALNEVATNLLKQADTTWGGFGQAPKFPQTFSIQFLLRHHYFTGDEAASKQALLSLDKMIYGGIYDQLGGGFARYSTDEKWLAPHFEKMLYDNALLIMVLAEAYQLTGKELYSNTIHHTMQWVKREMLSPEGGFYSALDADSEGVEGKFYTWSKAEVEAVLGDDTSVFCEFYDVSDQGNWEHTNILWVQKPLQEFATERGLNADALKQQLETARAKLFAEREKRIRPALDDKILLSWNALMSIACCKAYAATGLEEYRDLAVSNITFVEQHFQDPSSKAWLHTYKKGVAKYPAFLDDYAYLVSTYIHLQEITGNGEYLHKARDITDVVFQSFADIATGFFYFTSAAQTDVIVRKKEIYDGATPSGNSTMASNLMYLGKIFNKAAWTEQSLRMTAQLGKFIQSYPTSFGNWAGMVQAFTYDPFEIAITGGKALDLLPLVLKEYTPFRVLQAASLSSEEFPLLSGKNFDAETLIYVCRNYSCSSPVKSIDELKALLKRKTSKK